MSLVLREQHQVRGTHDLSLCWLSLPGVADLYQPIGTDIETAAQLALRSHLPSPPQEDVTRVRGDCRIQSTWNPLQKKLFYQIKSRKLFCERQKVASLKDLFMFPMRSKCRSEAVAGGRLCASHLPVCSLFQVTWQNFPTSSYNSLKKLKTRGSYKGFLWYFTEKFKAVLFVSPFSLSKSTLLVTVTGGGNHLRSKMCFLG